MAFQAKAGHERPDFLAEIRFQPLRFGLFRRAIPL
jgi:hypothetical protein